MVSLRGARSEKHPAVYSSDDAALEAAGKKQVLKREWNLWAVIGMSSVVLCTWEATSALFASAYLNGGPASVVYGFIVSVLGTLCIGASLAEMASISPIAGAQYHWTAEHAPKRYRVFISYLQGWITVLGWQAAIASVCFLIATMVQVLAVYNNPSYVPTRWQATLIMIASAVLFVLVNTFGKSLLPITETIGGVLHILFFFIVMIAILATSEKASNKDVWGTFINSGGWSSDGVSFCLGFLTPAFALAGVEAVVHMSEEAHNANVNIPRAMISCVVINGLAAFAYILTILYSITDANAVLSTPTGFPIIAVFQQATGNPRAATAMLCAVLLVFLFAVFGAAASVSRLTWAFARDSGLPFSTFFSHITPWNKCPTRAVILTGTVTSLLALINIGSTTAFNAFLSLATIGFYFSYGIPIVLFLIRRFNKVDPIVFGPWRMGHMLGVITNVLAIMFCIFLVIFLPFPTVLPVTAQNMNYASPIFIGVILIALTDYVFRGHKKFVGPIRETRSEVSSETGGMERQNEVMGEKVESDL